MTTSPIIEAQKELENIKPYTLTPEESEQHGLILNRIIQARNMREMTRDEFDGMSYEQAYLSNKRAAMSYLTPKKNDDEIRINTGTTEKRIELIMNELLALNLESEVRTFDKDDQFLEDVSNVFTDLVKRSEQIELAKDKDIFIYQELLTQPSVYVEELWIKEKLQNETKKGFRERYRADRRLIQGVQMYLGDVNLPDTRFNEQPYLVKYCRMSYSEAKYLFESLNPTAWKSVQPGAYQSVGSVSTPLYRKGSLNNNEVECFYYMSYPDNEAQVYVNGIPFLKVGTKYTEVYGKLNGYHITMVSLKPYGSDFAYGKPLTQSAKTLQALDNETIRNLIFKFRQALRPPIGIKGGKMWSRDIWNPGSQQLNVKPDDFSKLIDHQGVNQSEFGMYDLIQKKINEFIGTSQTEPLQNKTGVTATELRLAQENAIKMLGNSVLAVIRLKERLTLLRVKNLLVNATKPVGEELDPVSKGIKKVYAQFSLDGADIDGRDGTRSIQLMDRPITRDEEKAIFMAEQRSRKEGKPIEIKTVNVPALMDLELYFYATVTAKPRESSDLDKTLLTEMLGQAQSITAMTGRPVNPNKVIDKFERVHRERDLFEKDAPQMMQELGVTEGQPGAGLKPTQPPRPTINTVRQSKAI